MLTVGDIFFLTFFFLFRYSVLFCIQCTILYPCLVSNIFIFPATWVSAALRVRALHAPVCLDSITRKNKALRAYNSNFRESQLVFLCKFFRIFCCFKKSQLIFIYNLLLHSYVCTRTRTTKHTLTFHIFTADRREGTRP